TINGVSAASVGTTLLGRRWRAAVPGPAANAALTINVTAADGGGNAATASLVVDNDGIEPAIDRARATGADQSGIYSPDFVFGDTVGQIQRFANTKVTAVRNGGSVRVTLVA